MLVPLKTLKYTLSLLMGIFFSLSIERENSISTVSFSPLLVLNVTMVTLFGTHNFFQNLILEKENKNHAFVSFFV